MKQKIKIEEKHVKILFVIFMFCLFLLWAIKQPYDAAPDEYMKYDICRYIFNHNKLPHGGDEEIRNPIWGISYGFTPIVAYMFSTLFMKITSFFSQNDFVLVVAARLPSILFMTGYVIMNILIADKLFKKCYKWIFIGLTSLLPQIVFLGSYINNDSMALFSIGIIVYSWITAIEDKWSLKSCIRLAIGIGICALSYYNAYGFILCSIILFLGYFIINKIEFNIMIKKGLLIFFIAFLIAGWWFVRSFIIYDGDFLGLNTTNEYGEKYALEEFKPSNIANPYNLNVSIKYMLVNMGWILLTFKSFIGMFGYMSIVMPTVIYTFFEVIFLFGILGLFSKLLNENKQLFKNKLKLLFHFNMIFAIIVPIGLSIYYSYFSDFQPQGRYIMPMIIPFMYYISKGLENILKRLFENKQIHKTIIFIEFCIMSIIPIFVLFTRIIPFFNK